MSCLCVSLFLCVTLFLCACIINSGLPRINFISNSTVSFEGRKVQLICISTNDPDAISPLKVTWYNSYGIQLAKLNVEHVSVYDKVVNTAVSQVQSVVTFDPVKYTDTGRYRCQASNHPELHTEVTTTLLVECKSFKYCMCHSHIHYTYTLQILQ